MKKLIISLAISFFILGLTGCAKKLTCETTLTEANDGIAMSAKIVVSFANDLASEAKVTSVFASDEIANTYYEYMKEASEDYVLSGSTISITQKVPDDEKLSYDETKAQLEEEGYTCK